PGGPFRGPGQQRSGAEAVSRRLSEAAAGSAPPTAWEGSAVQSLREDAPEEELEAGRWAWPGRGGEPRCPVTLAMMGTAPKSVALPRKNAHSIRKAAVTTPNTIGLKIAPRRCTPWRIPSATPQSSAATDSTIRL